MSLGNALFRSENYSAAAAAFEKTAKLDPKTEDIEYLIGYCDRAQGQMDQAREHLQAQLKIDPKHVRARAGMGFILLEQGDLENAQKELERAVALDAENVDALFDLARTYAREKQADKAIEYFERVLPLSPDNTQAHYQLFLLYTRSKQQEKANAELEVFHRLEDMEKMVRREESLLTKARKARADQENPERPVPQAETPTAPPPNRDQ